MKNLLNFKLIFTFVAALMLAACGGGDEHPEQSAAKGAEHPGEHPGAASTKTLVYTAIPDQDARQLEERFAIVTEALKKSLGVDVKYIPVKSYSAAVTAFVNDEVQLAWFGGFSGVQARLKQPGARAIAQGVEDPSYRSYMIAHHSTGLKKTDKLSDEFMGKTFTFGSKGSTSGRLMPEFFIRQHYQEAPDQVFSRIGFSGDHSRTIQLVQSGAYELGVLGYTTWKSEMKRGNIDTSKVSIVWQSPDYPDYQWTIRGDMDEKFGEGFGDKVQQAILDMKDPELLSRFPRSGFIPAQNSDFQPILDTARSVGLIEDRQ